MQEHPDFVIIAEPWIHFDKFPRRWLIRLGLKLLSLNNRNHLKPNLWCICAIDHHPIIHQISDQFVAFSVHDNNKSFGVVAVYASTCYLKRRVLWNELSNLQNQFNLPWCYIGDFNAILEASEHRGRLDPARIPMSDFQDWSSNNDLLHLPTRGAWFTWNNGRGGRAHIERRLDRTICNQLWLNFCSTMSCSTLTKLSSDHFPLLLEFQYNECNFKSHFKFMKMWSLKDDCRSLIANSWNANVIGCPMFVLNKKLKILKENLKVWNKNCFGNVQTMVRDAEKKVNVIQTKIQNDGHTESLLSQEKKAQADMEGALKIQDWFWQEKAKVNWHTDGDRNTAYFHRATKIKNATKLISSLRIHDQVTTNQQQISDHIVQYFNNLFCANSAVLQDPLLVEEVIPNLVTDSINTMLTMLPSQLEIKNAVFDLNKEGASGPDGFGAFFYQTYWDIVSIDVTNAVLEFFTKSWLLPNFNANTLILIPKNPNADTVDQYRPIAMANFKFKIISKIIADRLAKILPGIISEEQRGFIQGRNIKDCICLASEASNLLNKKSYGGNLALKIDISKAFDTMDWKFLLKVLKCFGFNDTFCTWIDVILKSATLSISINGKLHGYFHCDRGVRQGDPLSPLLFCIAEDVLSRSISKLVEDGKLDLIQASRNVSLPSHSLYADDIMVYCKGKHSCLIALKELFQRYALASGQMISASKSIIFSGSIPHARLSQIANFIGFKIGQLPFTYLGVPIFKGKPKVVYFQPVADKVRLKLAAWKASLLSIAGRVQLVKSVVQGMLIHSITVYSWPTSLLRDLEKYIKNFIWSGDTSKRKLVTVSWKNICKPYDEGGLGIRSLIKLNEASNLKLCWNLANSDMQWARILRSRTVRGSNIINHHIFSSLWSSVKQEFSIIRENSKILIGDGENTLFWTDKWGGPPLCDILQIPPNIHHLLKSRVSDYIQNYQWNIPWQLQTLFPNLKNLVEQVTIPVVHKCDKLVWTNSASGDLSLKEAYLFKSQHIQNIHWAKTIWSKDIPPSKSLIAWRIMHDKMPTDEKLRERGCNLPFICNLCLQQEETTFHLFFDCSFSIRLWTWLSQILNLNLHFNDVEEIWKLCDRSWTPQCRLVIKVAIVNILATIWFVRNQARFNNKTIQWRSAISLVSSSVSFTGNNTTLTSSSSMTDFQILKKFNISIHPPKAPVIKEVI
ncbi:uncharacterized protein [Medicago truncatula]|uniref:uncharacterized protein n=1 Tax=Medicago truncatula TaxID=3880 RepID=UPI000D2F3A27|nr:uncharacterized protein LOC112420787 [Medicago truncatula]